jgi:hypothetical protein
MEEQCFFAQIVLGVKSRGLCFAGCVPAKWVRQTVQSTILRETGDFITHECSQDVSCGMFLRYGIDLPETKITTLLGRFSGSNNELAQ